MCGRFILFEDKDLLEDEINRINSDSCRCSVIR